VHPHLLYCNLILSCSSQSNIKRIYTLQKKAIRLINKKPCNAPTLPLFFDSKILPFDKLIMYSKLMMTHSIHYNYAPKAIRNMFPINANRNIQYVMRNEHEYQLPFVRIELFRRFPLYTFPLEWNAIDTSIQHQSNKTTFSIVLKDHLFTLLKSVNSDNSGEP
jgi:hypothetical protein